MGKVNDWFRERFRTGEEKGFVSTLTVPGNKNTFWYYWGGLSVFLLVLQVISGALLTLYYKPTSEDAFESVKYISERVEFGSFIRSLHYWTSHALIAVISIHLLRTFFMRSYRKPRELMWIGGVFVLIVILASAFTGLVLPWSELSFFSAAVGISQIEKIPLIGSLAGHFLRGGAHIGIDTPGRMFSLHAVVLPLFLLALFSIHVFLSHYWGFSKEGSSEQDGKSIKFYFDFFYRVFVVSLASLAVLTLVSLFLPKGFGNPYDMMNPTEAPLAVHPEWYFMWIFQMLKLDAFTPDFFAVSALLLFTLAVICVPYIENRLSSGRGAGITNTLGIVLIAFIIVMTIWAYVQTGFNTADLIQPSAGLTGGMDKFSFAGIVIFTILFMMILLKLRMNSNQKKQS